MDWFISAFGSIALGPRRNEVPLTSVPDTLARAHLFLSSQLCVRPYSADRSSIGSLTIFAAIPSRLVAREQLGCGAATGFFLAIDVSQRLPVAVAHDEAGGRFLDSPRRREAAASQDQRSNQTRSRLLTFIQCGEPQSSSASRFTAGASGFLTLTQCAERPER